MNSITVKDLSPDQRSAYDDIMRWVAKNPAPGRLDFEHDEYDDEDEDGEDDGPEIYKGPLSTILTLGGYAGTGKSTLVSLVAEQVDLPAFCAYTGKATSVLRRKLKAAGTETIGAQPRKDGMPSLDQRPFCGTIHSLIYRPCVCLSPEAVALLKPCFEKDCPSELTLLDGVARCVKGHRIELEVREFEAIKPAKRFIYAEKDDDGRCKHCKDKGWLRRDVLDRGYSLIIVDEASMVDDMMLRDLREYGVPILAVGDHGQLPPVGGSGSLMRSPHLRLEKIHRQAEGNPIIALSKFIRETGNFPDSMPGDAVTFGRTRFVEQLLEQRYSDASAKRLLEMGLICYTNRSRVRLNTAVRRARGTARNGNELPVKGEHVVCLRNMKGERGRDPVANGMRGVLTSDAAPKQNRNHRGEKISESETQLSGTIEFVEDEIVAAEYTMLRKQFNRDKTYGTPEELANETGFHSFSAAGALFDFGYAMTCHKMQGSQVGDLVVLAERPTPVSNEDWRKWCYTAATRAASKLTVLR